ncbi:MAG: methyltransferase domain-containing protein, partial [Oscillospiraceae bacterium]
MAYSAFAEVYDRLTTEISYPKRAEYFCELMKKYNGRSGILLDLACGTGSLSVEFAKRGFDVIGVDGSCEMLSLAMQKNEFLKNSVLYLNQQMDELDLYGTVDVTVCALDSLSHVTDLDELDRIFAKVSLFSNPEALFIFDVNSVYKHKEVLGNNTFVYDMDDVYCVWQNTYNDEDCVVTISLDIFKQDGEAYYRESETFDERAYTNIQMDKLIEKNGLQKLAV